MKSLTAFWEYRSSAVVLVTKQVLTSFIIIQELFLQSIYSAHLWLSLILRGAGHICRSHQHQWHVSALVLVGLVKAVNEWVDVFLVWHPGSVPRSLIDDQPRDATRVHPRSHGRRLFRIHVYSLRSAGDWKPFSVRLPS
jgi:hypothetical protein